MSTASTTSGVGRPARARRPATRPATGPPSGGSSRTKVTGRLVGTCSPTTTTSPASRGRGQGVLEEGRAGVLERRLVGTVEPRGGPAGEDHGRELHDAQSRSAQRIARARWQAGGVTLRVALVQHASGLEPEDNRRAARRAHPRRRRPGRVPGGVRPRLRAAGRRRGRRTPSRSTARSRARSSGSRPTRSHHRAGRDVRGVRRPGASLQHAGRCAGAATADYRKVHLYDSFGYRESDRLSAGPDRRRHRAARRLHPRPDDLLRPAVPRAGAGAGRRRRRRPGRPVGLGGGRAQGRPLADAGPGPGDREHGVRRRGRPARPALHRPLDGRRPARRRRSSRPAQEPVSLSRDARPGGGRRRPAGPTPRSPTAAGSLRPRGQEHSSTTRRNAASVVATPDASPAPAGAAEPAADAGRQPRARRSRQPATRSTPPPRRRPVAAAGRALGGPDGSGRGAARGLAAGHRCAGAAGARRRGPGRRPDPPWLPQVGAVVVATTYVWALAARTGGRPVVFGVLTARRRRGRALGRPGRAAQRRRGDDVRRVSAILGRGRHGARR